MDFYQYTADVACCFWVQEALSASSQQTSGFAFM